MVAIEIHHLTFTYPLAEHPTLTDLNLQFSKGELVSVLGSNGAGKSTLCYLLAGYGKHFFKGKQKGSIRINGNDIDSLSRRKLVSRIGFLTQSPANQLSEVKDTVYEELAYRLENLRIGPDEMRRRIDQIMKRLSLSDLAGHHPQTLSGGQLQKVVLASNLVIKPELLILDEPFSRLDPVSAEEMLTLIHTISRQGTTILATENRIGMISQTADKVCLLADGSLLASGPPDQVLNSVINYDCRVEEGRLTRLCRCLAQEQNYKHSGSLPISLEDAVRFLRSIYETSL